VKYGLIFKPVFICLLGREASPGSADPNTHPYTMLTYVTNKQSYRMRGLLQKKVSLKKVFNEVKCIFKAGYFACFRIKVKHSMGSFQQY
jgi:hypothetical protein